MQTPRSALIAAWVIVVLAAVGLLIVLYGAFRLVATAVAKTKVIPGLGGSLHWLLTNSYGSSWALFWATILLATVTLALFLATLALGRAANVQSRLAGPYLNVMLLTEELAARNTAVHQYFQQIPFEEYGFEEADAADPNLAPLIASRSPEYVSYIVSNKQPAAHGVAAEIQVDLTLYFGASSGAAPGHPFSIKRQIRLPLVEPNTFLAGRIFNVAGLSGYMVSADQVEYRDISGLRRGLPPASVRSTRPLNNRSSRSASSSRVERSTPVASDTDKAADGILQQIGAPPGESSLWAGVEPNAPVDFVSPRDDSIVGVIAVFLLMVIAFLHHLSEKDDSKPKAA